ncbi:MAG: hypothetical protein PHV33_13800 [Elusimicrobiales bacterium]|nr:hypothetical protein [Elusimicrobiales bacterium]
MQESGRDYGWLKWLLIIPACAALGALAVRWGLAPIRARRPPVPAETAAPAPAAEPAQQAAPAARDNFELQSDETTTGEAGVVWGEKPAAPKPGEPAAAAPPAADPATVKKDSETGFVYGALTKAAGTLLNNPKALTALFNNEYVVKGFMSRATVKNATSSKASLSAYLKNPANLSKFLAKPPVQAGLKRADVLNAMAGTKMVGAMLDTPGGRALLADPAAMAAIVQANPDLALVLADPAVMGALMSNPKTAGIVNQGAAGYKP